LGPVEHISSDVVRKNVEILKIILNRVSQLYEDPSSKDTSTKSILVFMHRIRGEIRFFDPYSDTIDPREWTCLRFCFSASPKSQESFSLDVSNIEEKCFSWEDLKPEAFTTLKETIKTVRFLSRLYPKLPNLSTTLKKFSLTDVDSLFNRFAGKDIIHEAWYSLDKKETESLLSAYPSGTFLFRKDSFAEILEEQLSLSHKETIACITLSFTSDMKQICDKTLVKNKKGWTVYNDDPNLETQFYPSIYSLLDSLKNIINTPLILLKK
jgi:hypothetical protein